MAKAFVWVCLALLFFSGSVVATETWREYESWQDRPLGVLEVLFGVAHQGLPEMPEWACDKSRPSRLMDGKLTVHMVTIGSAVNPYTETQWEELLGARLRVPVDVEGAGLYENLDVVHGKSLKDRDNVYLALRDGYFRGEHLNEKVEGVACNNLAIVNANSACQEGVAAHELAHVLGVRHSADGLMRPRAASCPATLDMEQTAYLLANSRVSPTLNMEQPTKRDTEKEEEDAKGEETEACDDFSAC